MEHSPLEEVLCFKEFNRIYAHQDHGDTYLMFMTADGEVEIVCSNEDGVYHIPEDDKEEFSKILTRSMAK